MQFDLEIKMRDDEIASLKDYKLKKSTKMIGESLEQHCETEFEKIRATAFQGAYFKKDSDAKLGSKGDYIFKDFDSDGNEYISIMFEMKNESKETEKKMKNKSFLKELDKDRNEKKCEWAVLVSTLESDNEIYDGITDMSHEYPKMFVVRPDGFIPIISVLRNMARKNIDIKMELVRAQQENIDVTKILSKVDEFKSKFSKNLGTSQKKSDQVIDEIDKAIKALENTKKALQETYLYLNKADSDLDDLISITLPTNRPKEISG